MFDNISRIQIVQLSDIYNSYFPWVWIDYITYKIAFKTAWSIFICFENMLDDSMLMKFINLPYANAW